MSGIKTDETGRAVVELRLQTQELDAEMKPQTSAPFSAVHRASGGTWGGTSNVLVRSDLHLGRNPRSSPSPGRVPSRFFPDLGWSESFCVLAEAADLDVEEEVLKQMAAETMA